MKSRVIMLVAALGALILSLTVFVRSQMGIEVDRIDPKATTEESGPAGLRAAFEWLSIEQGITSQAEQGAPVQVADTATATGTAIATGAARSMRTRFEDLDALPGVPRTGNLLIVSLPARSGIRGNEFLPLHRWVSAGNTLLVLAGVSDPSQLSYGAGSLSADLSLLTGLQLQPGVARHPAAGVARSRAVVAAGEPVIERSQPPMRRAATLVPNRPHAYFVGVRTIEARSDFPMQSWSLRIPNDGFVLELAHDRETSQGALWTRAIGDGRVVVSTFGSLFSNRNLGTGDNARLLANIVAANLGAGGVVLFDDLHQGLTAGYDPEKFYTDPRLYTTLGILVAVWLSWILGSTSLSLPTARSSAPNEVELVRTTGRFFARVMHSSAGALRIFARLFQRLPPSSDPPWKVLEEHPRIAAADVRQLQEWYADAQASRRVPLIPLHNLVLRISGQLAS